MHSTYLIMLISHLFHKTRADPSREIPIQNRSVFAIYLFPPYHIQNLLAAVTHPISQKVGKALRKS